MKILYNEAMEVIGIASSDAQMVDQIKESKIESFLTEGLETLVFVINRFPDGSLYYQGYIINLDSSICKFEEDAAAELYSKAKLIKSLEG